MKKVVLSFVAATVAAFLAQPSVQGYGGCHGGYTHTGAGGTYHAGYTSGAYGGYSHAGYTHAGPNGVYHAGTTTGAYGDTYRHAGYTGVGGEGVYHAGTTTAYGRGYGYNVYRDPGYGVGAYGAAAYGAAVVPPAQPYVYAPSYYSGVNTNGVTMVSP